MRRILVAIAILSLCPVLNAQKGQQDNGSVIKMVKAGISDDLIISTIEASPGDYDTSADGLIALKTAGASDKVVSAIVKKVSSAPQAVTAAIQGQDQSVSASDQKL